MRRSFFLFFFLFLFNFSLFSQSVNLIWGHSFGGAYDEVPGMIISDTNGQIVVVGAEESTDGDISLHFGAVNTQNVWVVFLDSLGTLQKDFSYGGSGSDRGQFVFKKNDQNMYVGGITSSIDGGVIGDHHWINDPTHPTEDYWFFQIDTFGVIQWQGCYGGSNVDEFRGCSPTFDKGYLLAGSTTSNDGDVTNFHGFEDFWFVKIDSIGTIQWSQCIGHSDMDIGVSCCQLADSSYLVSGYSESNFGNAHGGSDVVIAKLDVSGNIQWTKCFGGIGIDNSVKLLSDGLNFYSIGNTTSNNGDVSGFMGYEDIWIFKCDSSGNIIWQKCLGGSGIDVVSGASITSDGGVVFTGYSSSNDSNFVISTHGQFDIWAAKIDSSGNLEWGKSIGGSLNENGIDITELDPAHYLLTAYTESSDGDMPNNNHGLRDLWVGKLEIVPSSIQTPTVEYTDLQIEYSESEIKLSFSSKETAIELLSIVDETGRVYLHEKVNVIRGKNNFEFSLPLTPGLKIISLGVTHRKLLITK